MYLSVNGAIEENGYEKLQGRSFNSLAVEAVECFDDTRPVELTVL